MRLFCIIGKSCSGKDTVVRRLVQRNHRLRRVVPYTTRPRRPEERDGQEYRFITDERLDALMNAGKVVDHRVYETTAGTWRYAMVDDGQVNEASGNTYLCITTPTGAERLIARYGDCVRVICVNVDDDVRLLRAYGRELVGHHDFVEMCRRFVADDRDFRSDCLRKIGAKVVDNLDFESCLYDVLKIMGERIYREKRQATLPKMSEVHRLVKQGSDDAARGRGGARRSSRRTRGRRSCGREVQKT